MFGSNSVFRFVFLRWVITVLLITTMNVSALPPSWWHEPDATGKRVIDPAVTVSNNFGPANIGQAKFVAKRAIETLRIHAPSVANSVETDLVGIGKIIPSWDVPAAGSILARDQFSPLQIGQLKALADPFYRHLHAAHPAWLETQLLANQTKDPANAANYFPWTSATNDDQNRAIATIGQLKAVFSLDFAALQNPNVVINEDNMLRLRVVGRLLVRVSTPAGLNPPGVVNLQFTRMAGNGSFPGGITDVNRLTNSSGEVSAADYISPEDDIIRVSLHTPHGAQTVWLPANISEPQHIVRTGSGGSGYVPPAPPEPGLGGPEITPPSPDPPGGAELVAPFSNYISYNAEWKAVSIGPSGTTTSDRRKLINWNPALNRRIIESYSRNTESGQYELEGEEIVGNVLESPGYGYEVNAHEVLETNVQHTSTAEMEISGVIPAGFQQFEVDRARIHADRDGNPLHVEVSRLTLAPNPVTVSTTAVSGYASTILGPFVSTGPTSTPGFDNQLDWNELTDNVYTISAEKTKSLRAEVFMAAPECEGAVRGLRWSISSTNENVWVSVHHNGVGAEPTTNFHFPPAGEFGKEVEILIKAGNGETENLRSNITLQLVHDTLGGIVQKEFVVDTAWSSDDDSPNPSGPRSPSKSMVREESSGPRYRKIALNGRPLADEKPQAEAETDEADEETYVDALTRELRHSTSDIYVPVPASDLVLAVKRNITSEVWNPLSDLLPSKDPTLAFGPAWRTNLAANITMTEQVIAHKDESNDLVLPGAASSAQPLGHLVAWVSPTEQEARGLSQTEPNYVSVTDEDGGTHRFMIDNNGPSGETRRFVPAPGAVDERAAHEMSLRWKYNESNQETQILEFKRKHGNTLEYEHCIHFSTERIKREFLGPEYGIGDGGELPDNAPEWGGSPMGPYMDNVNAPGDKQVQAYNYFRLRSVTDRLGNKLVYTYDPNGPEDIVPTSIHVDGRPELVLHINSQGGKVTSVSDPNGNVTSYLYHPHGTLDAVRSDNLTISSYGYKRWEEKDYRSEVMGKSGLTLLQWAALTVAYGMQPAGSCFQYGEMVQHWDVDEIRDAANNTYKFHYKPDLSHQYFENVNFVGPTDGGYTLGSVASGVTLQYKDRNVVKIPMSGYPPDVFRIGLPGGDFVTIGDSVDVPADSGIPLTLGNIRHTTVRDAEGKRRTYYWDKEIAIPVHQESLGYLLNGADPLEELRELASDEDEENIHIPHPRGAETKAVHVFYTRMGIRHDDGGRESYTFSVRAGGALKSVNDFSGNTTRFGFGQVEDEEESSIIRSSLPGGITPPYSSKPTSQRDAAGVVTWYTYGPHEMITRTRNNGTGLIREFGVDSYGRSCFEKVRGLGGNLLSHTSICHHAGLKGFVIRKTVENEGDFSVSNPAPAWIQPLTTLFEPDSLGRLAREASDMNGNNLIDAGDLITAYTYDRNGNKLSATDPAGYTTWFHYDKRNRLVAVVHPDGTEKKSVYDVRGKKVLEYDEKGIATGYVYDARGRMTKSVRDMNGNLSHGPSGLTGIDAAVDLIEEKVYNKVDSVVRTKDPRGYISVTEYDHLQRPVKTILPAFNRSPGQIPNGTSDDVTSFFYEHAYYEQASGTPIALIEGLNPGASCFDTSGFKPTKVQDPRGYVSYFKYDMLYRLVESRNQYSLSPALFARKTNYYDLQRGTLDVVEEPRQPVDESGADAGPPIPGGRRIYNYYDALLRLQESHEEGMSDEYPAKTSESRTFYSATGLVRRTERKLNASTVAATDTEYDRAGRAVKVISPVPSATEGRPVVSTAYDPSGLVIRVTDPRLKVTEFVHDARGRQIQQISPSVPDPESSSVPPALIPVLTDTEYDKVGNVVKVTNPNGHSTSTEYDNANRPTRIKAPTYTDQQTGTLVTPVTVTTYDQGGNVLTVTDPRGSVTRNAYDSRNRLVNTVTNPTVPLSSTVHPDDCIVRFGWDKAGNRTRVQDGAVQVTSFEYDGLNRLTATIWDSNTSNRTKTEINEYDALAQTAKIDPRGCRTDYEYEDRMLLTRSVSAGVPAADVIGLDEARTYDHGGRLLSVTDAGEPLRNVSYAYDGLDRVVSETSAGYTHTYGYDLSGNRTAVNYLHTSRSLTSTYDNLNRLEKITETGSGRETTYRYDLAGNVLKRKQANGTEEFNGYDPLGRRTFQRTLNGNTPVSLFSYFHDPVGNVTRVEEDYSSSNLPDRNVINVYDRQNRLKSEQADTLTSSSTVSKSVLTTYGYSKANNRTSRGVKVTEAGVVTSNVTESFTYGNSSNGVNSNQLVSYNKSGEPNTYTYDENGNRITRSVLGMLRETYRWDARNWLVSVFQSNTSKTYNYGYDYRSRRVIRNESAAGGDNTVVSFSGGTSAFEKVGATTSVEYIRGSDYGGGIGGVMYSIRSGTPSFNAYNGRGDVVAKTNAAGTVTWQATYEAFGTRTKEHGTNLDRQKANTKEEDPTGLLNEGFRYRDLATGVFISRDPLGFVDGPNVYTYVRQNPWSAFDPLGLEGFDLRQDRQIQRQFGVSNLAWDAGRRKSSKIITGTLTAIAGLVPWVGDALDAKDVVDPSSTKTERAIGGASLGINAWTAGVAPNAGPVVRGTREVGEAIDDVIDIFRSVDGALDDAMDVSQREIRESQADAMRDMAEEGLIPSPTTRGQVNEANKLDQLGEKKNTKVFETSEGATIPDINNETQLGDIKDVNVLGDTRQMKAQREASRATGKEHIVHTGTNTAITKPMQESGTRIERHDDLGPQKDEP